MNKVNLGCGGSYLPGFLRVDILPKFKPDVLHDLNVFPYPFQDNEFEEVLASHIIEHLDDPGRFLAEVFRITAPGGKITIVTPHYSNVHSFSDFTHKWHLSTFSFEPERIGYYTGLEFKCKVSVKLRGLWQIFGLQSLINNFDGFRRFWERYLSFIIRATDITFILTVTGK